MYPHERSLVKQLADKPFALIGVNSDRDREKLKEVMQQKDITWRSFWNGPEGTGGPISTKWNVRSWPTIYVIDTKGKIRFKNVRGAAMDKAITELLGEVGSAVEIKHEEPSPPGGEKKAKPKTRPKKLPKGKAGQP